MGKKILVMDDKPMNILLIEDDPTDVKIFKQKLGGSGDSPSDSFQIEYANRLKSAMERLREPNRQIFDLIIADLNLPDSHGMETITLLQNQAKGVPILVLTGILDETLALEMAKHGVQDYLVKTELGQASLMRTIQYAVERHRLTKEKDKVNAELGRLILMDPLTELFNRRGLEKILSREVAWVRRQGSSLTAILLDIDDFKRINDTFGYLMGDQVLKQVAQNLAKALRATDYVSRVGGDEFVILLPQTELANGLTVAEKIRLAIAETPISLPSGAPKITVSLGVSELTSDITSIDKLLGKTNLSLSKSKREGKNRVSNETSDTHSLPPA